jgi:hypothetical protein
VSRKCYPIPYFLSNDIAQPRRMRLDRMMEQYNNYPCTRKFTSVRARYLSFAVEKGCGTGNKINEVSSFFGVITNSERTENPNAFCFLKGQ